MILFQIRTVLFGSSQLLLFPYPDKLNFQFKPQLKDHRSGNFSIVVLEYFPKYSNLICSPIWIFQIYFESNVRKQNLVRTYLKEFVFQIAVS